VLPYVYTPTSGNSKGTFGILLAWLFVSEMRGSTASEIDAMFHERVQARGFKNWNSDHLLAEKNGNLVQTEVVHVEKSAA
jgi:hypothetical protein